MERGKVLAGGPGGSLMVWLDFLREMMVLGKEE
jgi:hypothetical protein